MQQQINELWQLHNVKDGDGVPVWYVRKSLETNLRVLSENIAAQTEVLREMMLEMKQLREKVNVN